MDLSYLWFWIVGVLFVGYFVLDGFDFGVGMSLPFLGKDDISRRQVINTIGPVWDLNETWLIVAGACLFAAFPEWYATLFSGFYLALLLILLSLILRGVSFEYRHRGASEKWKRRFDTLIVIGSVLPALLWGVAVANIVQGVPLDADHNFTGSLLTLLNPYGLLGGVTLVLVFFTHGLYFVALKTDGQVHTDAKRLATKAGVVTVVVAAAFLIWTIVMAASKGAPALGFAIAAAAIAAVALIASILANLRDKQGWAFTFGVLTVAFAVLTLWFSLFPNVMPSTTDPAGTLTIENASSTPYTLTIMTWAAFIFLPLVLLYQGWTYWVFRKRVTRSFIEKAAASAH
ncbi:MAG: cytochrome d ubiquinol oxidase subunit II [Microbacterium sp.]|jgi:cytochrome d ubiquinol oxidase subunit II|uniref:Cytochrome bd-I ubiquinol oxidase subunit 2 n=1 Tax=Microbacterium ginsengisoli TaxID=400772 RepID=A0A0F0LUL3_9MICO|nr:MULTISPECIES: cytochrome d ubiquinol oxidase subunit II [Microbacterium]MAL06817.1 cytochrome d ubiquinol oxidase subunit II [Microbacterium sp.]MCK9915407.1 cytochrome d ubiquinol oxidase subunit II [Microbacteriaceae bacterium K1510]KJL36803.1 Cytochrome bd-I ubiquinol oxidase subunit 2 [Microbacterium ginsengisoli]KQR94137.1 cytochrome C oxidase assembly protein [Microbacterium sp. Leaf347]MBN9198194.1 cytochrome d ubiquinol oxidase subunit II [Microbacterium ginsengisoli]